MRKSLVFLLVPLLAVSLWGCGSNRSSGGDQTANPSGDLGKDPVTGLAFVGAGTCVGCHEGFSWSAEDVEGYLGSKHVVHSTHVNAGSPASCLECHDRIGDGPTLESKIDAANVPAEGLAAVGCENCHGAGGEHFGVGPIPRFNPDYEVCGQCHNKLLDSHIPHHPLADSILDNYKLSAHFEQDVRNSGTCMRCHSDEGFRTYIGQTQGLNAAQLDAFMAGKAPVGTDPVQCRTCHDPHSGGMRVGATMIHRLNGASINGGVDVEVFSSQFNLCTSCHQAFVAAKTYNEDTGLFTYELAGNVGYHDDGAHASRVITDTHFADPATGIAGYNINAAAENACTNCHDPHAASKFEQVFAAGIATEWGNEPGFHGDYMGPAFEHGCTPCHSPEGLIELTVGGEYAEADTEVGVIACVACHDLQNKNAAGDGFELGALRPSPEFAFDNARTIYAQEVAAGNTNAVLQTVDGLEASALCMTCHSGRESTASVDAKIAASAGPYSFTNIHYLAAGATLFGNMAKGAYEYAGKSYASKFEHVASNDLCVECHSVHDGHLAIAVNHTDGAQPCNACHAITSDPATDYAGALAEVRAIRMNGSNVDYDGDGDVAEGMYGEVATLIEKLEATLNAAGIMYVPASYPYFFPVGTTVFERANAAKLTATQLRAAYNLQVASKDPGAYAHNGTYIIEILYDSIEDLGGDVSTLTRDAAGHFDAAGEPFRHWDGGGEMEVSCAKCHSSEGAIAFIANGTVTEADFQEYTKGISAGLSCEVCHTAPFDPAGTTRSVTSVTFPSGRVLDASNAPAFFANNSPLCMNCHQGRESGQSIDSKTAGADGTFRFVNIHYYAAAGSLFGSDVNAGYEYAGGTYAGTNTFPAAHAGPGFNTCEGCHMTELPNHTFKPDISQCNVCHGGGAVTTFEALAGSPAANFNDIQALKATLKTTLEGLGVNFLPGYPYFGNIRTLDQLRAAYNYQVADKEPCGYIHNGTYIKQLLFDSIAALGGTPPVTRP